MLPNGALFLLLTCFSGLVYGEVAANFNNCLQFFYRNEPPKGITGSDYRHICQLYHNAYRFATLYDIKYRTPLYSAYKLHSPDGKRPRPDWMIEPQLANSKGDKSMKYIKNPDQNVKESQAVNDDYTNSGFTRGHLAPSSHQATKDDRTATFTLTNIVPQAAISNNQEWNKFEQNLSARFKNVCKDKLYVVTGIIPYQSGEHKIKDRVFIPEYIWSAYCCNDNNVGKDQGKYFPTYAAVGRNDPNSGDDVVKKSPKNSGYDVREMPLEELEAILKKRLNMNITLFDGHCGAK
ncbi:endonuclease domain-containing 1 protein-like [Poecilia formosa]|uniref:Endonuclease domain-containing 1 protein-like n=1 Tax=Poecilia formosa TaxID=48698 RepID=A0A087XMU2_POEFO|nr:PREDICTED: endonuclease domain-containing 1 protein-like [Poecilia formosa]